MTLELRLCGDVELLRGGQVLALPPSVKTRALLAYLAMSERELARQQLVDLLWDVADDPRGGLRWSLSRLRALLDEPERTRVIADRDAIRLQLDGVDVDARAIMAANVESASARELTDLCARVRGEFCAGIELADLHGFHAWCLGQRADLRRRHARMRERLVQLLADQPEAALPHSRVLCQLQPEREVVHADQVRLLRALGDAQGASEYQRSARNLLVTQHGRRELLLLDRAQVDASATSSVRAPSSSALDGSAELARQQIRYCRSADGARIAYAELGSGPTLMKVANWISHLEHELHSPVWLPLLRALSRDRRLIRYDQRGIGLSDRKVDDLSGARQREDLEAVMDAAGCERVALLGISQGVAVAIDYAARHPERVSHLVLYGGYALGWNKHGPGLRKTGLALAELMRTGWGQENPAFRQLWTTFFIPDAPREAADWFNEMQRASSSGETATRLLMALGDFDVTERLAEVRCPTLVMHLEGDQMIPIAAGQRVAAGIPGAVFMPLRGGNHIPLQSDPAFAEMIAAIDGFLRLS